MQRTVRSSCGVARKSCGDFDEPLTDFGLGLFTREELWHFPLY